MSKKTLQEITSHCKEYGFVFQSSEIYEGLSAVYDYGTWGVYLKRNLQRYWWDTMTMLHENIVGIDTSIMMHPNVWKASGHVDHFSDPLVDNKDSKKRYRVDDIIEAKASEYLLEKKEKEAQHLIEEMHQLLSDKDYKGLKELLLQQNITCSVSGTSNWTEVRQFNLMFATCVDDEDNRLYLRPETAQGIFVNFLNVQKSARMKIPFGIAQIGKAFRNEIIARQFIFRMREFEQMEMQFFCKPGSELSWYEYWKNERMKWHQTILPNVEKLRFHNHDQLAHYANAACDIEYQFPFGFKEVEGIHSRTDYDLTQHQKLSGKKLHYFDTTEQRNYIPYVIETSIGLDRLVLLSICDAFQKQEIKKENGTVDERIVLKFPPFIAPIKLALLPLTKKDGLPEIAKEMMKDMQKEFYCFYEEKDSIGKRYRRMDAIGTPFCITIDYQTKEDNTVTIRHRDSMIQERISKGEVKALIKKHIATS